MEHHIPLENINDYILIPAGFDWDLIDQELGFRKVLKYFPREIYLDIEESTLKPLIKKAAIHYAFVLSLPRLKVQITNYGIQEFQQEKMRNSAWWDVRDLGLSLIKVADSALSDAIDIAYLDSNLKSSLDYFKNSIPLIPTPSVFDSIYSINSSPEVFELLRPFMRNAQTKVISKIGRQCFDLLSGEDQLDHQLKRAIGFYSLSFVAQLPSFLFTTNSVVIQYEEMPWQKSHILDAHSKLVAGQNFHSLADYELKLVIDHMKLDPDKYSCYNDVGSEFLMQAKDSGLYL